jgi:predicted Na+-dependent transporter
MTSFSNFLALFMMPFNVWIYGRNLETDFLVIPYGKMSISLVSLIVPLIIGMFVNLKFPQFTPFLTQVRIIQIYFKKLTRLKNYFHSNLTENTNFFLKIELIDQL